MKVFVQREVVRSGEVSTATAVLEGKQLRLTKGEAERLLEREFGLKQGGHSLCFPSLEEVPDNLPLVKFVSNRCTLMLQPRTSTAVCSSSSVATRCRENNCSSSSASVPTRGTAEESGEEVEMNVADMHLEESDVEDMLSEVEEMGRQGRNGDAIRLLYSIAATQWNVRVVEVLCGLLTLAGRFQDICDLLEGKKGLPKTLLTKQIRALLRTDKVDEASTLMADTQTDDADMMALAGEIQLERGDIETSRQSAIAAIQRSGRHCDAEIVLARAMLKEGKASEACDLLLRTVVANNDRKDAKRCLAEAVSSAGTLDPLLSALREARENAPAVAYLATVLKDHGAVMWSSQMYEIAVGAAPARPIYALNLIHTVEIEDNGKRTLTAIETVLRSHFNSASVGGCTVRSILEVLYRRGDQGLTSTCEEGFPMSIWVPGHGAHVVHCSKEKAAAEKKKDAAMRSRLSALNEPLRYNEDELDLLAILFTVVKVVFLEGDLFSLFSLVELIEPARRGLPLHTTTIKNEHAYYCCIAQLLESLPPRNLSLKGKTLMYFVGDSHCLAPAWRSIKVGEQPCLCFPRLATGVKIFHMSEHVRFYPKVNLENVIKNCPNGANLIVMFGEIDCREGLLRAVQVGKYSDVSEVRYAIF
uniref:Uncharacterized protein n=1 Tax=Palpitomonas bilix TaxID=652834 RepID=A0A7S3DFI8_9EUKA|mmetsp:Transcript_35297/g.91746  ORF Transcript_35297/g.91746 Transcript_35297/m.91746 type:complete len:644 (+) Transcript_35297:141-2072(+)